MEERIDVRRHISTHALDGNRWNCVAGIWPEEAA
jgi:hypothetical protein